MSRLVNLVGKVKSLDRKSTRLNSSHVEISYAVFCLKKKKKNKEVWVYRYKRVKEEGGTKTGLDNTTRNHRSHEHNTNDHLNQQADNVCGRLLLTTQP